MAAGLRYKFHGSEVQVLTGFDTTSSNGIEGISKATEAVVTSAGHGLAVGDVVYISDVVGMTEINDRVYIVGAVDATTFTLEGTDSTGYGTYTSGGEYDEGEFSNLCELTNYSRTGGTSPEIPATSLCSVAQEYEIGLPDYGTTTLSFNFAPRTTIQTALHTFYLSGDVMAVKIILPGVGGTLTQLGFLQQETETAGVGGLWAATATIRNTGNRFDQVTA